LYDAFPDNIKQRLLAGKKVEDIRVSSDGVVVQCSDGTTEQGSIVVGADGVHSRVRDCIHKLLPVELLPGSTGSHEKYPFSSAFRCMYGSTSKIPGLDSGTEWDLHASGIAMQLFGGPDRAWFLFYEKLPEMVYERRRCSEKDVAQLAAKVSDFHVTDTLRFRDVWDKRDWCMMSDLQEGIVEHWHGKRTVLVGDTVAKQTPNIGQAWNCGIQDVVVLANGLRELIDSSPGKTVETDELSSVFKRYRETRYPDLLACAKGAAGVTRRSTWDTWTAWLWDRLITPMVGNNKADFRRGTGDLMSKGRVLDFIPEPNRPVGSIPWVYVPRVEEDSGGKTTVSKLSG
jgi:2-polyprenyl-6-methoxyphenol hydroxylase-like FAD-dependent oxidoreductase